VPRILLVEDDPSTVRRLRRLLMLRGGHRLLHAATVAEALKLLVPPPDWVILDMHLPDGHGLTILETIRRAGLPTRVVVSSSSKDGALIDAVTAYQPDLILAKPLNTALLPF
jgi:CheY-like chemotaxis protein